MVSVGEVVRLRADDARLLAAGWTHSPRRIGEYLDATGDGAPRWWTRALDLIARDGAP